LAKPADLANIRRMLKLLPRKTHPRKRRLSAGVVLIALGLLVVAFVVTLQMVVG
jgi:hypothetical protein